MAGTSPSDSVDRFRVAAALGLELSQDELSIWQASAGPSPCVALLKRNLAEAAGNADLLHGVLCYLHSHEDRFVRLSAACHPTVAVEERLNILATEDLVELMRNSKELDIDNAPSHILKALRSSPDADHRVAVVRSTRSSDTLGSIVNDASLVVTRLLADHKHLPPLGFVRLAKSEDSRTRAALAHNPSLPAEVAAFLVSDGEDHVRVNLAKNATVASVEILYELAKDAEPIRRALARHPGVQNEQLATVLSEDDDEEVRTTLAKNWKCPVTVLESLLGRVPDEVLLNNSATPPQAIETMVGRSILFHKELTSTCTDHVQFLSQIAAHPNASQTSLERIADLVRDESDASVVRVRLLRNRSVTAPILERFSDSSDIETRSLVGRHPSTPAATLRRLASDESEAVRSSVASNFFSPQEIADMLREEFPDSVSKGDSARRHRRLRNQNWIQKKLSLYRGRRLIRKYGLHDALRKPHKSIKNSPLDAGGKNEDLQWGVRPDISS